LNSFKSNFSECSGWFGVAAVFLTMINIVGGFMLTKRMLEMFSSKKKDHRDD
jgi:NAD/NADP transhydrogenase alpha subunit